MFALLLAAALLAGPASPGHAQSTGRKQQISAGPAKQENHADSLDQQRSPVDQNWTYNQASTPKQANADDQQSPWTKANVFVQVALAVITAIIAGFAVAAYLQSKDSSEKQLRAYVSHVGAVFVFDSQYPVGMIRATFKNAGQTPAYFVLADIDLAFSGLTDTGPTFHRPRTRRSFGTRGPGIEFFIDLDYSGSTYGNSLNENADGKNAAYVFGRAMYQDAFGVRHVTRFCHFVRFRRNQDHTVDRLAAFHNEAD